MTTAPPSPEQPNEPQAGSQPPQPPPSYTPPPTPPPGYTQPPPGYTPPPAGYTPPPQAGQPMPGPPMPGAPMQGQPGQPPMRPDEEKLWAIGAHLGPLLLGLVAPLVVWLVFKDRSAFLNRHGKEALNFQISYIIYLFVAAISLILLIGFVLLPAVAISWLVFMILAAVKASNFEDYRYPLTIRFIK